MVLGDGFQHEHGEGYNGFVLYSGQSAMPEGLFSFRTYCSPFRRMCTVDNILPGSHGSLREAYFCGRASAFRSDSMSPSPEIRHTVDLWIVRPISSSTFQV